MVQDYQENYGKGWISLYRSIKDHWVWSDPIKLKWWLSVLFEVNHTDNKVAIGYNVIECKRGQSLKSLRTWATEFECGTKAATKFFDMLEKDGMITRETIGKGKHSTTLLTVCNYDTYQSKKVDKETLDATQGKRKGDTKETQGRHKGHTNNNDNNANNENNEDKYPFSEFWDVYDKKSDRAACESKWSKLKDGDKELIMQHVSKYVKDTPDKKYRKNPLTYLNKKTWLDGTQKDVETFPEGYDKDHRPEDGYWGKDWLGNKIWVKRIPL